MLFHEPTNAETTHLPIITSETPLVSADETVEAVTAKGNFEELSEFEDLLEDAVDQALVPLIGTVPRTDLQMRREAYRAELDTLVMAHRELEAVPERAVAEAIAHFARLHPAPLLRATPEIQTQVASQNVLSQIRLLTLTQTEMSSVFSATRLALCVLVPFYLLDVSKAAGQLWHGPDWMLYRLEAIVVPLIGGLLVGLLNRRQAVRGTLLANALLAIPAVVFPALLLTWALLTPNGTTINSNNILLEWIVEHFPWFTNLAPGIVGLTCWPLLSSLGAAVGQRLSSRLRTPSSTAGKSVRFRTGFRAGKKTESAESGDSASARERNFGTAFQS